MLHSYQTGDVMNDGTIKQQPQLQYNYQYQYNVLTMKDAPFSGDAGIFEELNEMALPRLITVIRQPQKFSGKYVFPRIDGAYQVGMCESISQSQPADLALACCCPCVLSCRAARRLDENCCLPMLCGSFPLNVRFRTLTGINHDMCEEACQFCCCPAIATLRLITEMEKRNFSMERG